jgi:putative addiction module component (TIGR02574 family)
MTREALLQEVLRLPPRERAEVAAELLASLDEELPEDPAEVARAWGAEIERRARRALAGNTAATPWEEVRKKLEDRLAER